jgi:guanylate kinase
MMKNTLFIISGPSGSGKSSIARKAMDNEVISFTTRAPREGEVNGKDYVFLKEWEFDAMFKEGRIAEYTTYYGTASYGITMDELTSKLEKGDAFVVVDVFGKGQLENLYPKTVSIFIYCPYSAMLENRMMARGDSWENILKRMKNYDEEMENFYLYDYLLDNTGSFEDAVSSFKAIVGGSFDSHVDE